jgi:hypothetical protein
VEDEMARTWSTTTTFDVAAGRLLEVMTDEPFVVEQHRLDEAVVDAALREVSRTPTRLVQELQATEYGRGMTGLDRSKRERSTVTFDWDLQAMRCSWSYKGEQGGRVKVWGEDRIEAAGDRARLTTTWNIEVKIPLVGGQVEKMILKEVEKGRPKYDALVRSYLARRA